MLAAYAFVASGTSQAGPEHLGEFPVGLFVHDDTAYLLHYATGPYTPGPHKNQSLSLTSISQDATLSPLGLVAVAHTEDGWLTGAVTADTKGAVAFAVAAASSKGPFTVVLTDSGAPAVVSAQEGSFPSSWRGDANQLSIIKRDATRYWVYYSRAQHVSSYGNAANHDEGEKFPLFEIEDGHAIVLAERVVWARCDEFICQHVRFEDEQLRLYANPTTSDLYLQAVTEVAAHGASHENTVDSIGQPLLIVGDALYALSATSPSLRFVKTLAPQGREPIGGEREKSLSGTFADGKGIQTFATMDRPRPSYCDDDCQERYDVFVTRIELLSTSGVLVRAFSLHDY